MNKKILFLALSITMVAGLLGGATMAWFTDSDTSQVIDMSAGTLLIEAGNAMVYGVEQKTGNLYEIDVTTGKNYLLFDGTTNSSDINYPNGLAFDRKNNRLYYANPGSNLYFYDFAGQQTLAGQLKDKDNKSISVAGSTFGHGYYWYIGNGTKDLYQVSFDSDGKVKENKHVTELATGDNKTFGLGDLALDMKDGIIYGSSVNGRFFTIDIRDGLYSYNQIGTVNLHGGTRGLQLAFAADGNLYGHLTHVDGKDWYRVNTDDNSLTLAALDWAPEGRHFTDLASNFQNNWNPGDGDMVRYYVTNVGTKTSYVRGFISESYWKNQLSEENISVVLQSNDWVEEEGYYYYKNILAPGENTTPLILRVHLDGESTDNDYQGEEFLMQVNFEAIQTTHDAASELGWIIPN